MFVPNKIVELAKAVQNVGGDLFVVGGAVRDWLMGQPPVDFDLLIVGLPTAVGLTIMGNPEQVIGNAPVFMWEDTEVAFARREASTGDGKHAFAFAADSSVTLFDDLQRRDFTINAMAWHVLNAQLIDPFDGHTDIQQRRLRPVSPAFAESPERVLRGTTFAARFDFDVDDDFINMAKEMDNTFHTIPAEQVWRHWVKMCEKGVKPSRWFDVMMRTGWINHFPVLASQIGIAQNPLHHPEVWLEQHAMQVMDMARLAAIHFDVDLVFAITSALLHDVGKVDTTIVENGVIKSPGHAEAGVSLAAKWLRQVNAPIKFSEKVLEAVKLHMRPTDIDSKRGVRRLLRDMRHITLVELATIVCADQSGRDTSDNPTLVVPPKMQFILDTSETLNMSAGFKPLIMGRHLIDLGLQPGKNFSTILRAAADAQVEGLFEDTAAGVEWVKGFLKCG